MATRPAPNEKDKKRFQRAMQLLDGGQAREAIHLFDKVRKSWGDDPDIWYLTGLAHGKLNEMKEVERVSLNALRMKPDHFGALCNLANAQLLLGDTEGALESYQKSLSIKPNEPTVLDNYGRTLGVLGRREEAIEHFRTIQERNPEYAPAHAMLGKAYSEGGFAEKSFDEFQTALRLDPHLVEAHEGVGYVYVALGNLHAAEHHFREALRYEPHRINAHIGLATVQRHWGQFEKALSTISEAQDNPDTIAFKADIMQRMGNEEGAYELLSGLNERRQMPPVGVDAFTRICRTFDVCDDALELIELSVESPGTNAMQKQMLRYAAGNLLDKLQRYDEAFEWFRAANEAETIPFKAEEQQKLTDQIISYFSKEAMASLPRAGTGSTRPIFILGMPRSGTTLTEQILASHPDVHGAGELVLINDRIREIRHMPPGSGDFWAAHMDKLTEEKMTTLANHYLEDIGNLDSEAKHVTDKMPHNFMTIGLINLLFPEARIIHCRRNPLDTGLSIYFQSFLWLHNYATDLADIGCFYNEYHRLMQHWEQVIDIPMLNVDYEDMVEDTEGVSRKILEFCRLEWHDSVMDFYKSGRAVATSSYDQVRQPIYKTSRARWKNYERHIEPLRKALSENTAWMHDIGAD